jgi:hypothetical protein
MWFCGDDTCGKNYAIGGRFENFSRVMRLRVSHIHAAATLRDEIRAVQKQEWDYWAGRITLAIAMVGLMFGVFAYFKK